MTDTDNPCYELTFVVGEPKKINRIADMVARLEHKYLCETGHTGEMVIYAGRNQRQAMIDYAYEHSPMIYEVRPPLHQRMRFCGREVFLVDATDHLAVWPAAQ